MDVICLLLRCLSQMNVMTTIYLLVKQPNWVKFRCYLFERRFIVCMQRKQISKWKCHSIFACHNLFRQTPNWNENLSRSLAFGIQQLELNIRVYSYDWCAVIYHWNGCHIKRYKRFWLAFVICVLRSHAINDVHKYNSTTLPLLWILNN